MFGKKKVVVKTYNAGWIGRMKMNREMARMVGRGYQVSSTAAMPGHSTRSLLQYLIPLLWPTLLFGSGRTRDKVIVTYTLIPHPPKLPQAQPIPQWPATPQAVAQPAWAATPPQGPQPGGPAEKTSGSTGPQ
jgi:hypothetical protein